MGIFHFLNVKQGDCSIIEHPNGHVTVIDVCNARHDYSAQDNELTKFLRAEAARQSPKGNFGQKEFPVNPIEYMRRRGIKSIFRFLLTHPDMDHMDGIKDVFEAFPVYNFWDTQNTCEDKPFGNNAPFREDDWDFYKSLRDGTLVSAPRRLTLHAGDRGKYWNEDDSGTGGDGLHILAPTKALIASANERGEHNDSSYVILYKSAAGRIIIAGDSHDDTWEHILANHRADVEDVDLLVAPHHGRHSDRDFGFLNVLRPKLTLFGNASSDHLAYEAWSNRGLQVITNNQANCVIVDTNGATMQVFVTNETYARTMNQFTYFSAAHGGYFIGQIAVGARSAA
ncbi:MAG: hypothetical protein WDM86_18785 [Rhizomicrobium sp.]